MRTSCRMILAMPLIGLAACGARMTEPLAALDAPAAMPQPSGTWLDAGHQLLAAGQLEQAKDAFIRSMRVEGMTAAALSGAGIAAERQGLLTEAQRDFEMALARAPDSVIAHNNLGAVLYRLGRLHAARRSFRTAFALSNGTNVEAARNLDLAEAAIRRADAAEEPLMENPHPVRRIGTAKYVLLAAPSEPGDD